MNRQVPLAGQPNFRDLGGYASEDGRRVKWGVVYRSGELSNLSDDDVGTLGRLGIKMVIDLRSPEEVSARGEGRVPPGTKLVPTPITSSDMFARLIPMFLKGDFSEVPSNLLDEVNRALVRDYRSEYGHFLRAVSDPGNRPLVFHCTQGKDRTGFGAAVLLSALGVPWDTVVEDYLLSNHYRKTENEKLLAMVRGFAANQSGPEDEEIARRRVEPLLVVKEQSLKAARDEIVARHGTMESYLVDGLGCPRPLLMRLRDDLLE